MDIALGGEQVLRGVGIQVGDAVLVAVHGDGCTQRGKLQFPGNLGERTPHCPDREPSSDESDSEDGGEDAEQPPPYTRDGNRHGMTL